MAGKPKPYKSMTPAQKKAQKIAAPKKYGSMTPAQKKAQKAAAPRRGRAGGSAGVRSGRRPMG